MGENSGISWTHHTHNEWIGCQRVSPGCGGAAGVGGCYAQVSAPVRIQRSKGVELWGPPATARRMRTSEHNRKQPFVWNRKAEKLGVRYRVFCSSLSDVFEDHPDVHGWRKELFTTIEQTPHLDWQLLTKRPENLLRMLPQAWLDKPLPHVWLGTTVEDQRRANERVPHLLATPAVVRFLSCEPLLEAVDLTFCEECGGCGYFVEYYDAGGGSINDTEVSCRACHGSGYGGIPKGIHWLIAGGESGPGARPFDLAWARSLRDQCANAGVPYFFKQCGSHPRCDRTDAIQLAAKGRWIADAPGAPYGRAWPYDRAGADPSEWPEDLRVQQFPEVPRG